MNRVIALLLILTLLPTAYSAVIMTPCEPDTFVCEGTRFYGCEHGHFQYITTCEWDCHPDLGCIPAPEVGERHVYGNESLAERWVGEQVWDDRNPSLMAQETNMPGE